MTIKEERLNTIGQKKVLSFEKLVQSVSVSDITVRRDLQALNYMTSDTGSS